MISISVRIVFFAIKFSLKHQENLPPIFRSLFFFNKDIRISVASLLMLERNGLYILIKNHHREEFYGPIGGVYKHSEKMPRILSDLEWQSDHSKHPVKGSDMKNDLRGFIKGSKLADFLNWFTSRKEREGEQSIFRELDEELAEGKVGKSWRDKSSRIRIELFRHVLEGPRAVENRTYQGQFRYFEIFCVDPLCEKAKAMIDQLFARASRSENNLILATRAEIMSGRHNTGRLISGQTQYFFSKKWHGNEPQQY